jgi:hypothetical protein
MDANEKVQNREEALKENLTPTGRKYGIFLCSNSTLFKIGFADNKPGDIPDTLKGLWTKAEWAQKEIQKHLTQMWDMSDHITNKNARTRKNKEDNGQSENRHEDQ